MSIHQHPNSSFSLDSLYCKEEEEHHQWFFDDDDDEELNQDPEIKTNYNLTPQISPLFLSEQDFFWDEEELISLFSKEDESSAILCFKTEHMLSFVRKEAVDWILKVIAHYGFSALTAILAINYVDRFLSTVHFESDKPWMIQLVAVTCLSLAAKVEETQVPLLIDLQVVKTKYLFEAKTVQSMEIIVMSALEWRMNPVTPLSFLDHIIRRLGFKNQNNLQSEFIKQCETLLISAAADSRFVSYLPSVLASAAMIHVIKQVQSFDCAVEYENQLMQIFKSTENKVKECCQVIGDLSKTPASLNGQMKRKREEIMTGGRKLLEGRILNCRNATITTSNNKKLKLLVEYHCCF